MSNLSALAAYFGYYFLCSVLLLAPLNTCQIKFHSLILYPCIYYLLLLTLLSSTMVGEKMNTPSDEQKKLNSGQIPTPEETKLKVLQQKNGDDASEAAILKICQKHYLNMMSSNIDFVW
ncbi:hypothetical protein ACS0TY_030632 [Phlomoides rotata]